MVYLNNSEISVLAKKVIQKYKEYISFTFLLLSGNRRATKAGLWRAPVRCCLLVFEATAHPW